MIKNYFKIAFRNLSKNKFYSLINISGLSIGLAVGILILLWVQDELSFDRFHTQAKNIYRLENQVGTGSSIQIWSVTNAPIGTEAKSKLPQVKDSGKNVRQLFLHPLTNMAINYFQKATFFLLIHPFLLVFDFNLVKGNNSNPFPGTIQLSLRKLLQNAILETMTHLEK